MKGKLSHDHRRKQVYRPSLRVIGGDNYIAGLAGDGVNVDDAALTSAFPFLATPFDGRDRIHANP